DFKRNKRKILKGEESIISYKKNGSFPIRASQIKHLNKINEKLYFSKLSILTPAKAKNLGVQTQLKVMLEAGNGGKAIIDRIMDGTYELSDSKIEYKKQKNEFFLLMSYKFEKQKVYINKNRMQKKKKQLQKSRKWSGTGSNGRGVKTKMKPLENLKNKISNYKDTKNHLWS